MDGKLDRRKETKQSGSDIMYRKKPIEQPIDSFETYINDWVSYLSSDMFPNSPKIGLFKKIKIKWNYLNLPQRDIVYLSLSLIFVLFLVLALVLFKQYIIAFLSSVSFILYIYFSINTRRTIFELEEDFNVSVKTESYRIKILSNKAEQLVEAGKFEKAKQLYDELILLHPTLWYLYNNKGYCEIKLEEYESAKGTYQEFHSELVSSEKDEIKKTKYLSIINNQLGNISELASNYEQAYHYFLQSYKIRESNYAITNLLTICIKLHKFDEARKWLTRLKANSKYDEALNLLPQEILVKINKLSTS